jgi:hypothetical protein
MPPLANLFDMPVFVDQALAENPGITFNLGVGCDTLISNTPAGKKSHARKSA